MNEKQMEALGILQEECAELIQAISKIRRSSSPDFYPYEGDKSFADQMNDEKADVLILIGVCANLGCFKQQTEEEKLGYWKGKLERLKKWSTILN